MDEEMVPDGRSRQLLVPPVPMSSILGVRRKNNIASWLEIPFIHKRLIIACTLLGIFCGWIAILLWPRIYQSEARLIIRVGRESVALDPTATTSSTLMFQKTQEEEVTSALEVLKSRRVSETAVDNLGADAVLSGVLPDDPTGEASTKSGLENFKRGASDFVYNVLKTIGIKDDISSRELAVARLQASVDIHAPRKSNVIIIDAQAKTPKMAQAIVDEVTSSFLDEHLQAARTEGSRDFFEKQSAQKKRQLNELVSERSRYMQDRKIVSIESSRKQLEQQFVGIDRDLVLSSGELEQALSEIEDLKVKVENSDDEIVAQKLQGSSTWSAMRQRVYSLELDSLSLQATLPPGHPKIVSIRKELEGARKILTELKDDRSDESTTPNPSKTRLKEDLQKQQTKVVGLRSMIDQKRHQRETLVQQTNDLLESEHYLVEADRDIKIMSDNLETLRQKLEEARIIDELNAKKITNVDPFQTATFVERPVSPKKPLLAAGFLLLGLMAGLVLSIVREKSSPYLRTAEDVESQLDIPVLASIPLLRSADPLKLGAKPVYRDKCRSLIAELLLSPSRNHGLGRSVAIIGVDLDAGASTLAANLAVTSSLSSQTKTILVDADIQRRTVSKIFAVDGMPGLVELVKGVASHDECLQRSAEVQVDLIASAADSMEDTLIASAPEIVQALQAYQHDCELLIVDLPAASQPDQSIVLAQQLDSVLVVIESETTSTVAADRLLRHLADSNTNVVGVVLNKTRSYLPRMLRHFVDPQ